MKNFVLWILCSAPLALGLLLMLTSTQNPPTATPALAATSTPDVSSKPTAPISEEGAINELVLNGSLFLEPKDKKLLPMLKVGAAMLLQTGKCKSITMGSLSMKSERKDPLFYYHCGEGGSEGTFKLSASQIRTGSLSIMPPPDESSSVDACEQYARSQLIPLNLQFKPL